MRIIWRNGRFSWPFVVLVVYVALSLYAFDFAWRVVETPFLPILAKFLVGFSIGLVVLLIVSRLASRRRARQASKG
jgi:hypothetical protein